MPDKMGLVLDGTQKDDITTALNSALAILNGIKVVQLTGEERQAAQSASETRLPYIQLAIDDFAPAYPALKPGFMPLADAENDLKMTGDLREIILLINELSDRFIDFSLASEHFAYMYMRKFYNSAKEAQSYNTPGADTVVNALSPLFEGQGPANPPTP